MTLCSLITSQEEPLVAKLNEKKIQTQTQIRLPYRD